MKKTLKEISEKYNANEDLFNFIKEKREKNLMNVEYGYSHYLGIDLEKNKRYLFSIACLYVANVKNVQIGNIV